MHITILEHCEKVLWKEESDFSKWTNVKLSTPYLSVRDTMCMSYTVIHVTRD